MLAAFAGGITTTLISSAGINGLASTIATNGSPSVGYLGDVRTELRHLEVLLDDAVDRRREGVPGPGDPADIGMALTRLREAWTAYLNLPYYPGESIFHPRIQNELAQLARLVQGALRQSDMPRAESMLAETKVLTDSLDEGMRQLQLFNRDRVVDSAHDIARTWHRSVATAAFATALLIIFGALTTWAVWRLVRQNTLLLQQRADELEAFGGRVAHDLLGPLSAVTLSLSMVRRKTGSDRSLEQMQAALRRLTILVQDLYSYAQAGGSVDTQARAHVGDTLGGIVEQLLPKVAERGARVDIEPRVVSSTVVCAPGVLVSIFSNLIDNALKHLGASNERRILVQVDERPDRVHIDVIDSGEGIAPELLPRVFEPFVRGQGGGPGMGLGLATVKRLVEGHSGSVGVWSAPGRGSRFWFELPRAV
jgi:signal transduction histidine kinase